jgi:hypothetical protein
MNACDDPNSQALASVIIIWILANFVPAQKPKYRINSNISPGLITQKSPQLVEKTWAYIKAWAYKLVGVPGPLTEKM